MGHSLHIWHDDCGFFKTLYILLFILPGQNTELQLHEKKKKRFLVSGTAFRVNGVITLRKFPD